MTLIERIQAMRDNAYCDYISLCGRYECLGWKAKVETGNFGQAELSAHEAAAEMLGKHHAYHAVMLMLKEEAKS